MPVPTQVQGFLEGTEVMRKSYKRAGIAAAASTLVLGAAMLVPGTSNAADTFPTEDACHVVNNNMPAGNCGAFTPTAALNFNAVQVPLGGFSTCAGDGDFKCAGLKTNYPSYYTTLGAYPSGWDDTATSGNDGNGGRKIGGEYRPQDTMSVIKDSAGDGQLKVHMWHEGNGGTTASTAAGLNHVAAPVPLGCMNLRYGKFTERTKVSGLVNGYKMAHLRYTPNEVDYPEAGGNFVSDPISEFTHGFSETGADVAPNSSWTAWHTYSTEIVPGQIRFYLDGKLMKTVNADFPDAADWILQNESALGGGYAAKGTSVDINTSWVECYKYTGTTAKAKATTKAKSRNR